MNTNRYTYEMTKLAILAVAAAIAIAMLIPHNAHAKGMGDTIGAPAKQNVPLCTGAYAKANPVYVEKYCDAPAPILKAIATTTHKMTRAEKRAYIKELKAEIKHLQKLIKTLSR